MPKILLLICVGVFSGLANQPNIPKIFRATLDDKNRMVIVQLGSQLTAVYHTPNSGLYTVWNGGIQDGNATYTHSQLGSSYKPQGTVYHKQNSTAVWEVRQGGITVTSNAVFLGYKLKNDVATLRYEIRFGNQAVEVEEVPSRTSTNGLSREFLFNRVPANTVIRLRLSGAVLTESWMASGTGTITGTTTKFLEQNQNGRTVVTGSWS